MAYGEPFNGDVSLKIHFFSPIFNNADKINPSTSKEGSDLGVFVDKQGSDVYKIIFAIRNILNGQQRPWVLTSQM